MPRLQPHIPERLEFLCGGTLLSRREKAMLDVALIAGFVLFCLYVAYERLTHRL